MPDTPPSTTPGTITRCAPRNGTGGTGGPCTEMGCQSGVRIEVLPDRPWPAGHYRFALTADGATYACEGDLPLRDCDLGESLHCDADWFGVMESGCALPASEQRFGDIELDQVCPTEVAVEISRNGQSIGHLQLAPGYAEIAPNGEACGPICKSAATSMTVTLP